MTDKKTKIYFVKFKKYEKPIYIGGERIEINTELDSLRILVQDKVIFWCHLNDVLFVCLDWEKSKRLQSLIKDKPEEENPNIEKIKDEIFQMWEKLGRKFPDFKNIQ